MRLTAEKVAEVLALPEHDRAYLAHQLIASLDDTWILTPKRSGTK